MSFHAEEIHHTACTLCDGPISRVFTKEGPAGIFQIDRCRRCGFAFVNPTPSLEYIVGYYSTAGHGEGVMHRTAAEAVAAEDASPNSTLDAARVAGNLARLTAGRKALDVGCGYGFFSRALQQCGFACEALEIADRERRIASELLGFEPQASTFEDFQGGAYDAIVMSQVLEHAREPLAWLDKAYSLLIPGGVLAIALPNFGGLVTDVLGPRDPYVTPPEHLNYFTPRNLTAAARRVGFEPAEVGSLSRISPEVFSRRLGVLGRVGHLAFELASVPLDALGKGVMIQAYLRCPA
jgi:SAM-dependent methyltransferase